MDVGAEQLTPPRRSHRATIVLIAAIIVVAAVAGAAWWKLRPQYIAPAEAAPANALAFVELDVAPALERGTTLNRIWRLAEKKGFDETLKAGVDQVVKRFGPQFDVEKDLLDWCGGEVALVAFPASGGESDGALLITVRDLAKARKTLAKVRAVLAQDNSTFRESRHRGVDIAVGRVEMEPVAYAAIGKLIVFGSSAPAVKAVIDTVRDGKSLARAKDYQTAMQTLPKEAFVRAYWTAPEWPMEGGPETGAFGLLRSLMSLRERQFAASTAAFSVHDHGFRVEATSLHKKGVKPLAFPACTGEIVQHLPDTTAAVAVFGSPEAYWSLLKDLPKEVLASVLGPEPGEAIDRLETTVKEATGYGLREGWLSWMNGESAVALTRPQVEPFPAVALILGTDQPDKMKNMFTGLGMRAALIPGLLMATPEISHSPWLDSVTAIGVPLPIAGIKPVIATAEDAAVLASDAQTISSLLPLPAGKSLHNDARYERARAALPERPAAFLYVNAAAALKMAEQAGLLDASGLPVRDPASLVKGLDSFAIGFDTQPAGQRAVLWLGLQWEDLFSGLGAPSE